LQFFSHKVEIVPSGVRVDSGVKGERDVAGLALTVFKRVVELCVATLNCRKTIYKVIDTGLILGSIKDFLP
jgi:hypothetical protein